MTVFGGCVMTMSHTCYDIERFDPRIIGGIAGKGNRTLIASLEGWSFTIKLCPRALKLPRSSGLAKFFQRQR